MTDTQLSDKELFQMVCAKMRAKRTGKKRGPYYKTIAKALVETTAALILKEVDLPLAAALRRHAIARNQKLIKKIRACPKWAGI